MMISPRIPAPPSKGQARQARKYSFDEGTSLEQEIRNQAEDIETIIDIKENNVVQEEGQEISTMTTLFQKAKERYAHTLEEVQSYISSKVRLSADHVSTIGDLDLVPEDPESKRKLVIGDMMRLNFGEDEIREAVVYLEALSDSLSREELLSKTVEKLIESRTKSHGRKNKVIFEVGGKAQAMKEHSLILESQVYPSNNTSRSPRASIDLDLPDLNRASAVSVYSRDLKPPIVIDSSKIETSSPKTNKQVKQIEDTEESGGQNRNLSINPKQIFVKEKLEEVAIQSIECQICMSDFSLNEFEALLKCQHSFCRQCYKNHIEEFTTINKVLKITCPQAGCQESFGDEDVLKILGPELYERYGRIKKSAITNQNPNLRWCVRPGCDKYVIGITKKRKAVCDCGTKICMRCGNEYHGTRSCEKVIDQKYKNYAKDQHVQNCPKCHSRIEKSGGCNHMTCSICNYQWCWLCNSVYTHDHYTISNPNRCRKIVLDYKDLDSPSERRTYCSRICADPFIILGFPIFLILIAIIFPRWIYVQWKKRKEIRRVDEDDRNNVSRIDFNGLHALLGLILLPLSVVCVFALILWNGFVDLVLWISKKICCTDLSAKAPKPFEPQF